MPSTSSAVYRRSIGRPEIVVKLAARSGDFFSVGSSVSCSHRAFPLSATVFIQSALYPPPLSEKTRHQPARKSQGSGRRERAATNFLRNVPGKKLLCCRIPAVLTLLVSATAALAPRA